MFNGKTCGPMAYCQNMVTGTCLKITGFESSFSIRHVEGNASSTLVINHWYKSVVNFYWEMVTYFFVGFCLDRFCARLQAMFLVMALFGQSRCYQV